MNVCLIHDWLTGMRGGEKVLEVLCRRYPGAPLYTLLHRPGSTSPTIERMDIRTSFLQRVPGVLDHYRYLLPLMPTAIERFRLPADTELVVSSSHAVAKNVIAPPGAVHVSYCHTPMRYAWDQRADYFGGAARRSSWSAVRHPLAATRDAILDRIRDWDCRASDRVTHFVANSGTISARIRRCYDRDSVVIHPPVDTEFYTQSDTRRDDSYFCISALVPYKRIDLAVQACNRLGRRLIVIGDGPERQRLERLAGPTVTILGRQSDEVIREHYRRCRAMLFPGREDFGITPVEAQACGMPVIAFGDGGACETVVAPEPATAGGQPGTGLFFHQQTTDALARAICEFELQPTRFSAEAARRQAERFSADRFERELFAYIEQVVGGKPPLARAA
ncbi:MAG: glycosyltransferase [Pirellulales bacterium]